MKTVNVENIEKRIDWINSILKNDSFKKYMLPAQLKALRFEGDCLCKLLGLMENKNEFPNPVDGDVQALIADCQAEIEKLEKAIKNINSYVKPAYRNECLSKCQSELRRQQIALASLTAEPCAYLYGASFERGEVEGEIEDSPGTDLPVYTTPPAKLLRPVELPKETGKMGNDFWLGEMNMRSAFIKAIREAGYEVKND